ncbi:isoprenylcysteine carboxyl methyltransferase [Sorangium cellulosum]|uniref:Isoprenylcysteine carboxyl methyltransferase n=1 Tax=Sorangium cellulosum TaxID=56 RepID=A0A4P2Q5T2_SORCE|nr:isoprenylcysteine carboxylmethyltransferase family protein [Sorangium cellulosum]AUX24581.1 isoprenylcysteine carboxyl methyltransferase [Sorangium cellulosum]
MSSLAVVAWALYLLVAFVLRSVVQRRRTGSAGFVGVKDPPLSLRWMGGALFVVAFVLSGAAPALALAGAARPVPALDRPLVAALGALLFAAGLPLTLWSQLAMGASWRIGVDPGARTALVTAGPFRQVRNPIFTAMVLAVLGIALMAPSALALAAVAALVVAVEIQVRLVEEPYLARVHGGEYLRYAARAGRFLPGIGRLRARA